MFRIITLKKNFFSVRSSPDPPNFKQIAVRSSPDPAKIGVIPDPCSSLVDGPFSAMMKTFNNSLIS